MTRLPQEFIEPTPSLALPPLSTVRDTRQSVTPRTINVGFRRVAVSLIGILAIAIFARVYVYQKGPALDIQRAMEPDSGRYIELATNLQFTRTFARGDERSGVVHVPLSRLRDMHGQLEPRNHVGLRPEVFRTPGYPALIALWQKAGGTLAGVLTLQAALSALTILGVYLLGRLLLHSHDGALLAALVLAVHPADVLASNQLLSETFFITVMTVGLLLAVVGQRDSFVAGAGGLLLGLTVLIRPVAVLLGPAVAIWMFVAGGQKYSRRAAIVVLTTSLLAPGAWLYRNHHVGLGWRLSTVPSINALFYTGAYIRIAKAGGDFATDWPNTVRNLIVELATEHQDGQNIIAAMDRKAWEIIRAHPWTYAKLLGRSAAKMALDHSMGSMMAMLGLEYQPTGLRDRLLKGNFSLDGVPNRQAFMLAMAWTVWNALLLLLALGGMVVLAVRRQWAPLLFLSGIAFYFVFTTQLNGLERFRLPLLGVQALLVAACLSKLPESARRPATEGVAQARDQR